MARIRVWVTQCETSHEQCRSTAPKPLPRRVIDVGSSQSNPRLVETKNENIPYIALSHCWGTDQTFTTTKSTIDERYAGFDLSVLPKTFQDAIAVTRQVGIQYLWIDSFCIIQDDRYVLITLSRMNVDQ